MWRYVHEVEAVKLFVPITHLTVDCDANPAFHPVAAGGDGGKVQYWYVGYDTALKVGTSGYKAIINATQ